MADKKMPPWLKEEKGEKKDAPKGKGKPMPKGKGKKGC
jgi:hypothetical protein